MSSSRTKTTSVCAGVCASRAKTAGVASGANASSAVVSIGVDTGVNDVPDLRAVSSVGTGRIVVTRYWVAAVCAGVASAAEARCASVSASVSAGVSGSRAGGRAVESVSCEFL